MSMVMVMAQWRHAIVSKTGTKLAKQDGSNWQQFFSMKHWNEISFLEQGHEVLAATQTATT